MKSLLLVAALIGSAAARAAPAPPIPPGLPTPVVPMGLGVNIHFVEPPERDVRMIAAAGFGFVRMDFAWSGVERPASIVKETRSTTGIAP